MITYSHSARVVFKLGINRLYISCLRCKRMEKIFINSKTFYNIDKKVVECFSSFSFFLKIFVPSTKVMLFLDFFFYYQKLASPPSKQSVIRIS